MQDAIVEMLERQGPRVAALSGESARFCTRRLWLRASARSSRGPFVGPRGDKKTGVEKSSGVGLGRKVKSLYWVKRCVDKKPERKHDPS
eukprot:5671596-Pleurochrysis_carterae.AAC.1